MGFVLVIAFVCFSVMAVSGIRLFQETNISCNYHEVSIDLVFGVVRAQDNGTRALYSLNKGRIDSKPRSFISCEKEQFVKVKMSDGSVCVFDYVRNADEAKCEVSKKKKGVAMRHLF